MRAEYQVAFNEHEAILVLCSVSNQPSVHNELKVRDLPKSSLNVFGVCSQTIDSILGSHQVIIHPYLVAYLSCNPFY